ncbi:hypothetical protein [Planctopirus hydrillae]|uniref:Helix-turn-helix domain-containing protein n=1 Tax=Planctopirus hydrillae TaxID=1841610 RepID=A0A1C3ETX6_9PLAN|nr:hypothetical protein [Planctopirus hydrillae]ODA36730.1 hypothetical protein A6X21_15415 [Planctopirus hydrillae]
MARAKSTLAENSLPLLVAGGLYSQQQVIQLLKVTGATLQRWHEAGLPKIQPGTKQVFYFADDIFEVFRKPLPAKDQKRP